MNMSKQEKLKAIQLCLQCLMPKPTPEREDKIIVQHFEVEIIETLDWSFNLNEHTF